MNQPSKYDALARGLCSQLGADAVILAVINGPLGSGCCRAESYIPTIPRRELRAVLVTCLRSLADLIERDPEAGRVAPTKA